MTTRRRSAFIAAIPILAVCAAATLGPVCQIRSLPPLPQQLLGSSPESVIAAYGVPAASAVFAQGFTLSYKDKAGAVGTFLFHGDAAIQVPPATFAPAAIVPPKAGEPYSGQRAGEAALWMGNPKACSIGAGSLTVEYDGGRKLSVAHGRVFL
jgi:hypothetical protein